MEIGLFFNNFQDGLKNSLGKLKKACSHSISSSTSKWKWFKQIATQATKTFSFMTSQVENHSEIINVLALESYYEKLTCAEKKTNIGDSPNQYSYNVWTKKSHDSEAKIGQS